MKILIIGDFSSFSKNLSAGFNSLGHECFVFSWGDGFKKISQDNNSYMISTPTIRSASFKKILKGMSTFYTSIKLRLFVYSMSKKKKWDVILLINPAFIKKLFRDYYFSKEMILSLVCNNNNVFLEACGGDYPYYDYWTTKPWKNKPIVDLYGKDRLNKRAKKHFDYYASFINKVIPMSYTYAEAWRNSKFTNSFCVCPTIPAPIDTLKYQPYNEVGKK